MSEDESPGADSAAQAEWEQRYAGSAQMWSGRANATLAGVVATLTPGSALDVGCGEGADVRWLADHGWKAEGIDLSQTAIERARVAHADQPDARFEVGDVRRWSGLPGGYDLVAASFLHTTDDRAQALRAAAALVAPGGRLLLVSHAQMPPWAAGRHADHHHEEWTPQAERALLDLGPDWGPAEIAEIRERAATGPDGESATLRDSVLLLRRVHGD